MFYLTFWIRGWQQVTETVESKTSDKGDGYIKKETYSFTSSDGIKAWTCWQIPSIPLGKGLPENETNSEQNVTLGVGYKDIPDDCFQALGPNFTKVQLFLWFLCFFLWTNKIVFPLKPAWV